MVLVYTCPPRVDINLALNAGCLPVLKGYEQRIPRGPIHAETFEGKKTGGKDGGWDPPNLMRIFTYHTSLHGYVWSFPLCQQQNYETAINDLEFRINGMVNECFQSGQDVLLLSKKNALLDRCGG
jgi:hypothetical protein